MISQSNNTATTSTSNPVIAVIGIELGQGESTDLEIRLHDKPSDLARLFCKQKGLSLELQSYIEENIRVDQEIAVKELEKQQLLQKEVVQAKGSGDIRGQQMLESQQEQKGITCNSSKYHGLNHYSKSQSNDNNNNSSSNTFLTNNDNSIKHELSFQQQDKQQASQLKTQPSERNSASSATAGGGVKVFKTEHSKQIANQSNNLINTNNNNSNGANTISNMNSTALQQSQGFSNNSQMSSKAVHSTITTNSVNSQFLEMNKKILMERQAARSNLNHHHNNNSQQNIKQHSNSNNTNTSSHSFAGQINTTDRQQQQSNSQEQENLFEIKNISTTPSWLNDLSQFEWYAQLTASQPQRTSISKQTKQQHHQSNATFSSSQIIHPSNSSHTSSVVMLTSARQHPSQQSNTSQYLGSSQRSKRSHSLNPTRSERNNEQTQSNSELTFKPTINAISDIIAKGSATIQDPFRRLYQDALTKKKELKADRYDQGTATNSKKKRAMNSYNNSANSNPDDFQPRDSIADNHNHNNNLKAAGVQASQRLYADRQKLEFKRQEALERSQYEKMEKHIIECTHHPQLNSTSKIIASLRRSGSTHASLPVEEQLLRESQAKAIKISQLKAAQINQELSHCTFKPSINAVSNVLDIVKSSNEKNHSSNSTNSYATKVPRCEQLFNQAKVKQQKQTTQPQFEESPDAFKPQINASSRKIKSSFTQRQQLLQVSKIQRHQVLARQAEEKDRRDATTGREFFHPLTGRAPVNETHPDESVSDYLFKLSTERKTESEFRQILQTKYRQEQSQPQINQHSRDLMNQAEEAIIDELFEGLDSDKDGLISAKLISIDAIPPIVLEAISPVLFEMEEHEFILNRLEFRLAIQSLINKSPITTRQNIIAGYKKKPRSYSLRA